MMLISAPSRQEAEIIRDQMSYVELTTVPDYMDIYVEAILFNCNE
jgi:uncharacterized 2Fe-2S/4Fe-4S cluster protein (DUF4445 family)